jgi:uncharacterized protein
MKKIFVDTSYWIAILNPKDEHHEPARNVSGTLQNITFVTSEMVLTEFLNGFAHKGPQFRRQAYLSVVNMFNAPNLIIVPQTPDQFQQALSFYIEREDKEWSLTDCASILTMMARGINGVVTSDNHFIQAGFAALLI